MNKFLIILFFSALSFAQETIPMSIEEIEEITDEYDNNLVDVSSILDTILYYETDRNVERKFPIDFKQRYDTEDFDYSLTKPRESVWYKFIRALDEFLREIFDAIPDKDFGWIRDVIIYGLAFIVFGLVAYWLIKYFIYKEDGFFFSKNAKKITPEVYTIKENIHKIDFNKIISKYELEYNYRYAVRYQFLHLLKIFTDKHLIEWDPDKTNLDYINELFGKKELSEFKKLANIFDYVWYGEFNISKENYHKVKHSFNQLKQLPNE